MEYLKNSNEFNFELNEKLNISKYRNIFQKTVKDLKLNFYFISTFGMSIPVLYPIFEKLVKEQELDITVSSADIVLIAICVIGILVKENKTEIAKAKNILVEKGLGELVEKGLTFMKSINNIFTAIAKNTGKVLDTMSDLLAYSTLYAPFLIAIYDMINLYELGFDNFTADTTALGFGLTFGIGVVTVSLKHFLNMLVRKINRLTKKKIIKESIENIYSELI